VIAVALAELYNGVGRLVGADVEAWRVAAWINTLLALAVAASWWRRSARPRPRDGGLARFMSLHPALPYLPALVVLAGAAAVALLSRAVAPASTAVDTAATLPWAWILWVPLVEELVFRIGIGGFLRTRGGSLWGAWFSAVAFAFVHASPTLSNLAALRLGLPLGPFCLAIACETLVVATGRLGPAVFLHAACNATVAVFAAIDPRWLEWLGWLYS
jgi:membrane protease YdiL (CAAX protease family)